MISSGAKGYRLSADVPKSVYCVCHIQTPQYTPFGRCPYLWYHKSMFIEVTKLNDEKITINSDYIEVIEATPDTVITMTNDKKIIVKESRQQIGNLVKLSG